MNYLTRYHRLFDDSWSAPAGWVPSCDIQEGDRHYLISLETAGVPKDQIKVEFRDQQLVVSGERRQEKEEDARWYSERRFGRFERVFTLPTGVNPEKVEATYQDGILRVQIPKAEAETPRQIKIHAGSDRAA